MSIVRHTRTSLASNPSMAAPSDTGFVPLPQSYPTGVEVQDVDRGQSYAGYDQPPFTHSMSNPRPSFCDLDAQTDSSRFIQQPTPSMPAAPPNLPPNCSAQHSFIPSPSSQRRDWPMKQQAMQEYASDPAWPSMNGADAAAYDQHVPIAANDLQISYAHDQSAAGHTFDTGFDEYEAIYAEPPQQVFGPAQAIARPYPDPLSAGMDNRYSAPPGWQPLSDDDSGGGGDCGYDGKLNTSYAHLIYMCLLEAPNHSRKLKEIYDWIRIRTNKADDLTTNGWQNSVRHNLSMNKAFLKPSGAEGGKKLGCWRLDPSAIANGGVRPTSAHRAKSTRGKPVRKGAPAPQRANAGAKGGQATRDTRSRRGGKHQVRQHADAPRHYAPSPPAPQPYYVYPTPGRALPDSSVEGTPVFSTHPMLTPPATLSPQSAWQSPQVGELSQDELNQWSDFDFKNMQHTIPPTSEPTPSYWQLPLAKTEAVPGTDFASFPGCDFVRHGTQGFSAFSDMADFWFEGDDGLQDVLQRQLDECAALPVY